MSKSVKGTIRADKAEMIVDDILNGFFTNEKLIEDVSKHLEDEMRNSVDPVEEAILELGRKRENLITKRKRVFDIYEDGTIKKEDLRQRIDELNDEEQKISLKIDELESKLSVVNNHTIPVEVITESLNKMEKIYRQSEPIHKKNILHCLIKKIDIIDRKVANIHIEFDGELIELVKGESSDNDDSPYFLFKTVLEAV